MTDIDRIARETDTSVEIVRAIAEHNEEDPERIRDTIEHPDDFDAIVTRALELRGEATAPLRWQGRAIG